MDSQSMIANPDDLFKYSGKEYDTETGYSYFGARSYDGRIGRWMSVDPLADKYPGWSPYNYVMGNPLRLVDPDGMRVDDPDGMRVDGYIINSNGELEYYKD